MTEYAALSKTPHALTDGLMLVFQHPVKRERRGQKPGNKASVQSKLEIQRVVHSPRHQNI